MSDDIFRLYKSYTVSDGNDSDIKWEIETEDDEGISQPDRYLFIFKEDKGLNWYDKIRKFGR